jgi:hypothetical protein
MHRMYGTLFRTAARDAPAAARASPRCPCRRWGSRRRREMEYSTYRTQIDIRPIAKIFDSRRGQPTAFRNQWKITMTTAIIVNTGQNRTGTMSENEDATVFAETEHATSPKNTCPFIACSLSFRTQAANELLHTIAQNLVWGSDRAPPHTAAAVRHLNGSRGSPTKSCSSSNSSSSCTSKHESDSTATWAQRHT